MSCLHNSLYHSHIQLMSQKGDNCGGTVTKDVRNENKLNSRVQILIPMELILQILFISNIDLHRLTKNNIEWDQALKCSVQHRLFSTNNVVRLVY